jgi:hypothetical protein
VELVSTRLSEEHQVRDPRDTAASAEAAPTPARRRSVGQDALKGIAILMVIAQHTVSGSVIREIWGAYWIHQAVPIFLVLFGFNAARQFRRRGAGSLRELYSRAYLSSRVRRLTLPAVAVYAVIGAIAATQGRLHVGGLVVFGAAPIAGGAPGDYFVGLAVWIALLLPLVWACYMRAPRATLIGLVAISVVFELSARKLLLGVHTGAYFDAMCPLRAAAAVAAGIWLAEVGGPAAAIRRTRALAILALLSGLYLLAYQSDVSRGNAPGFGIFYPNFTADTGVWAVGWSLLLTIVLLLALDRAHDRLATSSAGRPALSGLAQLGKASYHVFLIQAAILGLWLDRRVPVVIVQVTLALAIGWLYWAATDAGLLRRVLKRTPA